SDRGSNYTSAEFGRVLRELGIRQSVGRTGSCYDNALAESFFAALKNERVHRTQYPTRKHAMNDIARYIELRYNSQRLHSGLGYKPPTKDSNQLVNGQRPDRIPPHKLARQFPGRPRPLQPRQPQR